MDDRQHPRDNLLHCKLAEFQGPSLISFNDAAFSEEDWEGIQRLQDSVKADDPFKVGQFGIGFNSVYHVTGIYYYCTMIRGCGGKGRGGGGGGGEQ